MTLLRNRMFLEGIAIGGICGIIIGSMRRVMNKLALDRHQIPFEYLSQ